MTHAPNDTADQTSYLIPEINVDVNHESMRNPYETLGPTEVQFVREVAGVADEE